MPSKKIKEKQEPKEIKKPSSTEGNSITTVKINKKTKERLEKLRSYKRESYDELIQKILEILNIARTDPDKARAILISIEREKSWKGYE